MYNKSPTYEPQCAQQIAKKHKLTMCILTLIITSILHIQ